MADEHGAIPARASRISRAEVSVLRRAIEALPAAMRESRSPDTARTLAVIGKGLDEVGEQLETILKSPALTRTPEQQGQAIANAGANLIREAAQRLDRAAQEAERERSRCPGSSVRRAQDRQFKLLRWTGGAAFAVGLLLSPIIAGRAALRTEHAVGGAVMRADRWAAGRRATRRVNLWDGRTGPTPSSSLQPRGHHACRAAVARSGRTEHLHGNEWDFRRVRNDCRNAPTMAGSNY